MLANRRIRNTWASCLAGLALLAAAGCGGSGGDKAGGDDDVEARVLTLANPNGEPPAQLTAWADEVDRLSGGTLAIEFENDWRQGEADYEAATIDDIQAGEVDVAWVGARAFDTVGVTSFQALVAPLLIDSHDLQEAVFEAGIPTEMLDGLADADLAGIGVLPGPMRKPLGIAKPFVTPADYAGTTVGIQDSAVAEQTLAALGATPRPVPSGTVLDGLDAYEQQLASIAGNHYSDQAGYVTANVNLWPRPLVIVTSRDALDSLTADQQDALREASAAAIPDALEESRREDDDAVPALCREGMTLTVASESQLTDLRDAVQPVYDELAADPTTKTFIDDITTLKTDLSSPPEAPECAADDAAAGSESAFPEGTYETTLTSEDIANSCLTPEQIGAPGDPELLLEVTFDSGDVEQFQTVGGPGGPRELGFSGTYTVFRDSIEITDDVGTFSARWSFDGTNLTLTEIDATCDSEAIWGTHRWVLTTPADTPAASEFPEGTFEMTLTDDDLLACDEAETSEQATYDETLHTLTLHDGSAEMFVEYGGRGGERDFGWSGTYTIFRDRIELTDPAGTMTAHWTFDGTDLTFSDLADYPGCGDVVVWTTHPWTLTTR